MRAASFEQSESRRKNSFPALTKALRHDSSADPDHISQLRHARAPLPFGIAVATGAECCTISPEAKSIGLEQFFLRAKAAQRLQGRGRLCRGWMAGHAGCRHGRAG